MYDTITLPMAIAKPSKTMLRYQTPALHMNVGFVNLALAKEDRVPTYVVPMARLFKNHEMVAISPTRMRNTKSVLTVRLDSSVSLPSHQPKYLLWRQR